MNQPTKVDRLPSDIMTLIRQYAGPRKSWSRYWKNQSMRLICIPDIDGIMMPLCHILMNDVYLRKLAYNAMDVHISLLHELACVRYHNDEPDFDLLLQIIKDNIKRNMSDISLTTVRKMRIVWVL